MSTYLIHGFRWKRKSIRIHVIIHDIDDAAPDWIIAPSTSIALVNSFYTTYDFLPPPESTSNVSASSSSRSLPRSRKPPHNNTYSSSSSTLNTHNNGSNSSTKPSEHSAFAVKFNDWSLVKFAEQYRTSDVKMSEFAYVGDYIIPIGISCDISKEIESYEQRKADEIHAISAAASGFNSPNGVTARNSTIPNLAVQYPEDGLADLQETGAGIRAMSLRDLRRRSRRVGWLDKLRDEVEKEAEIGWFVVVCEDEERRLDGVVEMSGGAVRNGVVVGAEEEMAPRPASASAAFKRFFRRSSEKSLRACATSLKSK